MPNEIRILTLIDENCDWDVAEKYGSGVISGFDGTGFNASAGDRSGDGEGDGYGQDLTAYKWKKP